MTEDATAGPGPVAALDLNPNPDPSRPVVLVGMMGSGKSNVGKRLAKKLGWQFVDSDDEIEQRAGRSISEIFTTDGEPVFREVEAAVVAELVGRGPRWIIATGGGAVLDLATRALLHDTATVVWLRATAAPLFHRIKQDGSRPLLAEDPEAALTRLVEMRDPLYREVAHHVIDVDHLQRKVVTQLVLAALHLSADANEPSVEARP